MNDQRWPRSHRYYQRIVRTTIALVGLILAAGCATPASPPHRSVYESGLNRVLLEPDPDSVSNTHPAALTPTEIGTLLRGIRTWEQRNFIHRWVVGPADRKRAFRDEEIALLAQALSKALAQATPSERVYFHLSHATEYGEQETTTGWLSIRDPLLYLSLSEAHDRHGPAPDISKYDRQMPNVPEVSAAFDVTFEPEAYLARVRSAGNIFALDQREELQIRYRAALEAMPVQPGLAHDPDVNTRAAP
ncbi:hypothetical protein YTPLAS18_14790 [Nitrospira sp.]|nr:hypothetical protein YTPLAS18_14790 [Nitrospira sp.]